MSRVDVHWPRIADELEGEIAAARRLRDDAADLADRLTGLLLSIDVALGYAAPIETGTTTDTGGAP